MEKATLSEQEVGEWLEACEAPDQKPKPKTLSPV